MDIYDDPMVNVADAARWLDMPSQTLANWKNTDVIHSFDAKKGYPTLPFVGFVEAFVLRRLRDAGFPLKKIRDAAEGVRKAFNDPYGLARPELVHDEAEIFLAIDAEIYRAADRQQAIRETVQDFTRLITWSDRDPMRVRLESYGGQVILDPRFGWGAPVIETNKVPVEAIANLWLAGETIETVAAEFAVDSDDVEHIVRAHARRLRAA